MAGSKKKLSLVIVESPAKAKKIAGFLGSDYEVRASVGHVRDLPEKAADIPANVKKEPWSRLGVNVDDGFKPLYVVSSEKKKTVKELRDTLSRVDEVIVATDEDREGESIGWHLVDELKPKVPVKRITFSEITKKAIIDALNHPRDIDNNLVNAQETRRILDRLYGYTLSPLLWKKIAPRLSAGRVQSVAVRLLALRELERLAFKSGTYWDLKADLASPRRESFAATLSVLAGKRIATGKDFDEHTGRIREGADVMLLEEAQAQDLQRRLRSLPWKVAGIEHRQQTRKPPAPFITSTLQQEANRKLNMSARETMQTAQRLYEDGYITYMRTDSVTLSQEAIEAARDRIQNSYGATFLSPAPRQYANKTKNAQEAHEAIRPAGTEMRTADELRLSGREARLYDMIWKRTIASQMADAQLRFDTVTLIAGDAEFTATGRKIEFAGYFRAYVEGSDDPEAALEDQDSTLPVLNRGETVDCRGVEALGHETKPPARYTEATLVRKLEAEGIGRPSTYASIIGTIQDRGYVRKQSNQLIPTLTAMAVNQLLERHFPRLVDLGFTADMEQSLDDISNGQAQQRPYLERFYSGPDGLNRQVETKTEEIDPREVCTIKFEGLPTDIRVGRYGPFVECEHDGETISASLPEDIAPADINVELVTKLIERKKQGPRALGVHPESQQEIYVLNGPFGPYLQVGDVVEGGPKPKRVSIPKNVEPEDVDLALAMKLLELPRRLGHHPEDGKVVNAGVGRFGPYVQHAGRFKSLAKEDNVLDISLDRAVELLKEVKTRAVQTPLKELGPHPQDGAPVAVFEGRYGPYVKWGNVNATIPKEVELESVALDRAVEWLAARAAKAGTKSGGRRSSASKKSAPPKQAASPKKTAAPKKTSGAKKAASGKRAKKKSD